MKTYGQTIIQNAKELRITERNEYIVRKMTELDEKREEAIFLNVPTEAIEKAIEEVMEYAITLGI